MTYPTDIEHILDFDLIRAAVRERCSFSIGKEEADAMHYLTDYQQILLLQQQTQQMRNVLEDSTFQLPDVSMHDLRESLQRCRIEGLYMDEQEFFVLRKALDAAIQFDVFFQRLDAIRFPALISISFSNIQTESELHLANAGKLIDRVIDKYGQVRDNASPELARIRRDLQQAQGAATRALTQILRQAQAEGLIDKDVTPTLREGRLVLPVPPAYKRKIGGIVHDESASGKTVFIEPQQAVEANNRIRELENDERREKTRILIELTNQLRPYSPLILQSQQWLGEVDFLLAKARYAQTINAISPQLKDKPYIDLREARNTVLLMRFQQEGKTVVPLTLRLSTDNNRILVISGPNAGGKSVCLKTVALLQYMLQCGLLVPVREDTTMGVFERLMIDIGDQQSIIGDLSTYSSHLKNMKYFLHNANPQTLFLIDEFGSGTEPQIGGAIAQAVMQQLISSGATGVITTHYDNLKHFAEQADGVLSGAMLYDRGALRPLFELSVGQSGSSFALEIAAQIGLPLEVINTAKDLVGDEKINYEHTLQDIARDRRYWERKREQVRQKEKQLQERIEQYDEQLAGAKQKRREILSKAQEEAEELLRRSNAVIEKTIRDIKEAQAEKEKTRAAREQLEQHKKTISETSKSRNNDKPKSRNNDKTKSRNIETSKSETHISPTIEIGSRVRKRGQTMIGEVVELGERQALVAFGQIQSYIPLKELEYVSSREQKRAQHITLKTQTNVSDSLRQRKLSFKHELDMRGMRADEALTALQSYIDDAIMVGAEQVEILHGTGTGALRQVVRQYLQLQPRVSDFHDAHPDHGGAGITVVEF